MLAAGLVAMTLSRVVVAPEGETVAGAVTETVAEAEAEGDTEPLVGWSLVGFGVDTVALGEVVAEEEVDGDGDGEGDGDGVGVGVGVGEGLGEGELDTGSAWHAVLVSGLALLEVLGLAATSSPPA